MERGGGGGGKMDGPVAWVGVGAQAVARVPDMLATRADRDDALFASTNTRIRDPVRTPHPAHTPTPHHPQYVWGR